MTNIEKMKAELEEIEQMLKSLAKAKSAFVQKICADVMRRRSELTISLSKKAIT
jgi:hypothetical protein